MNNEDLAEKLPDADTERIRSIEVSLSDASRGSLRAMGFNEDTIARIERLTTDGKPIDELTEVNGVGPQRAEDIYDEFGATTVDELATLANDGKLVRIPDISHSIQGKIQNACEWYYQDMERMTWDEADRRVDQVKEELDQYFDRFLCVGSYRRKKDTVGDLDFLAIKQSDHPLPQIKSHFRDLCDYIIREGDHKMTGRWRSTQLDIQFVNEEQWPTALQYFTGSMSHNIKLRRLAKEDGMKLNEYGLWDRPTEHRIPIDSEQELYEILLGQYIPPEARD